MYMLFSVAYGVNTFIVRAAFEDEIIKSVVAVVLVLFRLGLAPVSSFSHSRTRLYSSDDRIRGETL